MRGLKSTIALAVVLVGLGAYIYFVEWKKPEGGGTETKEKAFAKLEPDNIEEVRIKSAGGETAHLVKATEGWKIDTPVKADADPSEVTSITSNLVSLEMQRVVDENPSDLAQYGLNPPRVDVSFRVKGEKDFHHLQLGEKTPTGGDLYAKRQNEKKVFLVSSFLDNTFNRTPFDLREKKVLAFDRDKVSALEIVNGGTTLQLTRADNDWKMAKPIAGRADYGAAEGLVTRLSSGQMQRIVDAEPTDLKKYGLDKPALVATVVTGSARSTLSLGTSEGGSTYAKDASRPMVFAVEDSLATDLKKDVGEFRRKDVFDFRSFNANRVEISRGPASWVFEKSKDKDGKDVWKDAGGKVVDTAKVEDVLTKLSNLRAQSFAATTNPALKTPETVVTASFEGKMETVQFGRSGSDVFASRADEPGSAKLETTSYEDALKALDTAK
jgi:hypothetical protein